MLLAGRFTLLDRSGLDELLPLCAERGVAVLAAGLFGGGVLADPEAHQVPDETRARIGRLHELAREWEVPLLAAAAQFPFRHPAVTAVVVGARSPDEIAETAGLLQHPIPDAFWSEM